MPTTINREWVYPNKGKKPYFNEISQMYAQIDTDVQILFNRTVRDISPVITKGGLITDNGSATVILPVGITGYILSSNPLTSTGLEWIAPPTGGSTSLFSLGAGTLSAYRTGTTNTALGNYSFSVGQGNLSAATHSIFCGQNNDVRYGSNNVISGDANEIVYSNNSIITGTENGNSGLSFSNSIICGDSNNRTPGSIYNSIVSGLSNDISGDYNISGGRNNRGVIAESIVSGYGNVFLDDASDRSLFVGQNNSYADVNTSIFSGDNCISDGVKQCVIVGKSCYSKEIVASTVSGYFNFLKNSTGSFISGTNNGICLGNAGMTISLSAPSTGIVTLTDTASKFLSKINGLNIVISGSDNPTNNGTFAITYISGTQISFVNAEGIGESSNFYLVWEIFSTSSPDNVIISGLNNYVYNGGSNSIISGTNNSIVGSGDNFIIGGSGNSITNCSNSIIDGENNTLVNSFSTLCSGKNHSLEGSIYCSILGYSNQTTVDDYLGMYPKYHLVTGDSNIVRGGECSIVSGRNNIAGAPGGTDSSGDYRSVYYSLVGGSANEVFASLGSIFFGSNNTMNVPSSAGVPSTSNSIIIGSNIQVNGGHGNAFFGYYHDASDGVSNYNLVSGYGNVLGEESDANVISGVNNYIENADCSIIAGNNNRLTSSTVIANNYRNSIIGGSSNIFSDILSSLIIGSNNNDVLLGSGIDVDLAFSGGSVIFTDPNVSFTSSITGESITILGSINAGNNGTFVVTYVSEHVVSYSNASGVTESGNADIEWILVTVNLGIMNSIVYGDSNLIYDTAGIATASGIDSLIGGKNNIAKDSSLTYSFLTGINNSVYTGAGNSAIIFGSNNNIYNGYFIGSLIGGNNNSASDGCNYSLILGENNTCSTTSVVSSIISGYGNKVSNGGSQCVVSGYGNIIASGGGARSFMSGNENVMYNGSGNNSLIVGDTNLATNGSNDLLISGNNNTCNSSTCCILAGAINTIGSSLCSLMIGQYNTSNGANNSITLGLRSYAYLPNAIFTSGGHPDGSTETNGQGQIVSNVSMSKRTYDATPSYLSLNGSTSYLNIRTDFAAVVKTLVIAKCISGDSANGVASWEVTTTVNNVGGTLSVIGTPTVVPLHNTTISHEASWVVATVTSGTIFSLLVTGHANDVIRWQSSSYWPEVGIG